MIVEIDESMVPFLSWKDIDWYDRDYFQYNIAHIKEIRLDGTAIRALDSKYRTSAGDVVFRLDNTASDQSGGTTRTNWCPISTGCPWHTRWSSSA